jgi:23S rRNA (adenine2503-C2)-methyltransferase
MAGRALRALRPGADQAFADIVYKAGYASPIRTPRGEDIMAACGQLKSATERSRKSRAEIATEAGL